MPELSKQLQWEYKINLVGRGKRTVQVSMPRAVIEQVARIANISVERFAKEFVAIAHYDNDNSLRYTFERKK